MVEGAVGLVVGHCRVVSGGRAARCISRSGMPRQADRASIRIWLRIIAVVAVVALLPAAGPTEEARPSRPLLAAPHCLVLLCTLCIYV